MHGLRFVITLFVVVIFLVAEITIAFTASQKLTCNDQCSAATDPDAKANCLKACLVGPIIGPPNGGTAYTPPYLYERWRDLIAVSPDNRT
jgi:hypothetical protein